MLHLIHDSTIDYSKVPVDHMVDAVRRYIEKRIPPGDFLTAVICNDLAKAVRHADEANAKNLITWVRFFYNEIPAVAWGSKEKMKDWLNDNLEE